MVVEFAVKLEAGGKAFSILNFTETTGDENRAQAAQSQGSLSFLKLVQSSADRLSGCPIESEYG